MRKMTIRNLLNSFRSWPAITAKFYEDFQKTNTDVSFGRLLNTLIDQKDQYSEYFKENMDKLNLDTDFGSNLNELIEFEILDENLSKSESLSKLDFLRKAIQFHEKSISNCHILENMAVTDSCRQVFKELSDEEYRYMMMLKDRLELEELY